MKDRIEGFVFWTLITGVSLMLGCFVFAAAPAFVALWLVAPIEGKVFIVGAGLFLFAVFVGLAGTSSLYRATPPPPPPRDPWWRNADI